MKKGLVGILRGGPSSEFDVSLKTGASVLQNMPESWDAKDIFVDKEGGWHIDGVERAPEKILRMLDTAFIAMHGEYGEDGKIQKVLETHRIPFTGSRSLPSAIAMNKIKTKEILALSGVKTPKFTYVKKADYTYGDMAEIFSSIPRPIVVKPAFAGSSLGISVVNTFEDLVNAVNSAFNISNTILLEEFVKGREVTCGVLDHSNQNDIYSLYPLEIIYNDGNTIWDYKNKYSGDAHQYLCPSSFNSNIKREIQEIAHKAHTELGLEHYSRSDFLVTDDNEVYFLEVNTLPGLTETSLYPTSLKAVGIEFPEFIDHVLSLAIKRK